ncbi:mitochondrial fission regulator 1 [Pristis pectinata]|uniref:mitochondrial fission regulator 1 n=1 Tax=Pristis pectinata TaxID=685728 RepID=UPI00223E63DF|nr:mitochondrial fission regulator 1 [Pristis pectinata]
MFLFLVEVIRMFLGYAGVNMNSLQLFWANKPYGSSRSIIRRIGTNLPLKPCPRVHFQLCSFDIFRILFFHSPGEAAQNSSEAQNGEVASLADVGWIVGERVDSFTNLRSHANLAEHQAFCLARPISRQASLPNMRNFKTKPGTSTVAGDAALEKINLLENELAKLREQIAMIVTIQEQSNLSAVTPDAVPHCVPPLLPPPPPPLPPPPPFHRSVSTIDLIKERRGKKADSGRKLHSPKHQMPNMLEVLKDISKVKLRSVKKPADDLKPRPDQCADNRRLLIAAALKRKFAHRYKCDSSNERCSSNSDSKASTEPPKFGQHLLKPTGKRKSSFENTSQF